MPPTRARRVPGWAEAPLAAALLSVVGCSSTEAPAGGAGGDPVGPPPSQRIECSIPTNQVFSGGVDRGQIPDLTEPTLVPVGHPDADYLLDSDRVIGLSLGGEWVAVPHNILWWHEIAHFDPAPGERLVVTYCPLTGSSLVFDRGTVTRFQVSGLLFNNNLMMVDVETESLWPQMSRGARCGPRDGDPLRTLPSIEMRWDAWRALHPDTKVVSGQTGFSRDYTLYPYDLYEHPDAPPLLPVELDRRRRIKERVLGVPGTTAPGIAFPFFELEKAGEVAAVHETVDGVPIVVLWDGSAQAAAAYRPEVDGRPLHFAVVDGEVRDAETDSRWRIDGSATDGPLAGRRLAPITDSFVAFWFAWAVFERGTAIWEAG